MRTLVVQRRADIAFAVYLTSKHSIRTIFASPIVFGCLSQDYKPVSASLAVAASGDRSRQWRRAASLPLNTGKTGRTPGLIFLSRILSCLSQLNIMRLFFQHAVGGPQEKSCQRQFEGV